MENPNAKSVLEHTTVLHSTLKWPEGTQDVCTVCGRAFRGGQRVCVVDRRYYAEEAPEGLYAHTLCMQEKCREYGKYEAVSLDYGYSIRTR
jgi:hypothetical protein